VSYAYDDASRLSTITRGSSNFGFGYDNANRRTSMTYPNGITTSYEYDTLNRVTRLKADLGATPVTDFQYLYDPAGNRTRKQQLDYTEDYSYDPLYRLTGVERSAGLTGIWHYGYDVVGNRLTNQINDSVLTSVFNEKNQLTSSSGGGTLKVRGTLNEPGTAQVNGNPARMLAGNVFEATIHATTGTNTFAVEATDQSGNVTTKNYQVSVSATGATYTYDPNGNLTQKVEGADTWTYEWTAENQLKRVLKNSVEQARFAYDPRGRRVERVAGGVTTSWTYDENDVLRESAGASSWKYVHGLETDEPLAREDAAGILAYYHADGLGSITKITTPIGALSSSYRYEAFGTVEIAPSASGFSFTGREWDTETGLFYYRARYYDPKVGRFVSEDPIAFGAGPNFYRYVFNNPVNFTDPFGLDAFVCRRPLSGSGPWSASSNQTVSGPPIPFNPLYHEWICVVRNGKVSCGGQTPSGSGLGSPGMRSDDKYDEKQCTQIRSGSCYDQCLERKVNDPERPWYGLPFGTDCQEWTGNTLRDCFNECLAKATGRK
jgi:RHS repeat-associated protein